MNASLINATNLLEGVGLLHAAAQVIFKDICEERHRKHESSEI